MEAFVQTVRLKSFSAAARRRGQSPSAIARQVSALEKELGVQLLLQQLGGISLTDDLVKLGGLHPRVDQLLEGLAGLDALMLATIANE